MDHIGAYIGGGHHCPNKLACFAFGPSKAVWLSFMFEWGFFLTSKGEDNDGWFFADQERIYRETGISKDRQTRIVKFFEAEKIVQVRRAGMPPRNWYKLDGERLLKSISQKLRNTVFKNRETPVITSKVIPSRFSKENPSGSPVGDRRKKPIKKTNPEIIAIIKLWNNSPNTTTHKLDPATDVYGRIERCINDLKAGTFMRSRAIKYPGKEDLLTLRGIRWSTKAIKEGIKRLSLMCLEGYWPPDKASVRNLADMLYNSRTGSSMFLKVMIKAPVPLEEEITVNFGEFKDDIELCAGFGIEPRGAKDAQRLLRALKGMKKFHDEIPKNTLKRPKIFREIGSFESFLKTYIQNVNRQGWIRDVIGTLNPASQPFQSFVSHLENSFYGYKLQ